jgi:uncharacterized membrane protein YidH (DUF202 family)
MSPAPDTGDSGVVYDDASERTDLAWVRSALAFGGVGVALLKDFKPLGKARPVDGFVAIALAAAVLLLAGGYMLRNRNSKTADRRSLLLVSSGTFAVGVIALVIGATS